MLSPALRRLNHSSAVHCVATWVAGVLEFSMIGQTSPARPVGTHPWLDARQVGATAWPPRSFAAAATTPGPRDPPLTRQAC